MITGIRALPSTFAALFTKKPGIECGGIVDTGFSGFIQLPFDKACELRLPLEGTAGVTLADGSTQVVLTALGIATLGDNEIVGTIHLSFSSEEILVGMEFLRKFNHGLGVFRDTVFMLPEPPPVTEED